MASIETAMQVHSVLSSIDAATTMEGSDEEAQQQQQGGESADKAVTGVSSLFLYSVALVAIVTAGFAIYMTTFFLADFASATVLVLAPLAIAQKRQLSKLGTLRAQQNELRVSVNKLSVENNQLQKSVVEMEGSVNELKGVETELEEVAQKYGGQADRLCKIIEENGMLQKQIQKNLESQVIQNILTLALKNDKNMNFTYDESEMKRLKLSVSQIPGVTLDMQNFDQFMGSGGTNNKNKKELSLSDIMKLFRNILNQETPEEKRIVHLTPREIIVQPRGFFR